MVAMMVCNHTHACYDVLSGLLTLFLLLRCFCDEGLRENVPRKRRSAAPETKKTMYHYDGDHCAAFDCLKPTSNKVSWVGTCSPRESEGV